MKLSQLLETHVDATEKLYRQAVIAMASLIKHPFQPVKHHIVGEMVRAKIPGEANRDPIIIDVWKSRNKQVIIELLYQPGEVTPTRKFNEANQGYSAELFMQLRGKGLKFSMSDVDIANDGDALLKLPNDDSVTEAVSQSDIQLRQAIVELTKIVPAKFRYQHDKHGKFLTATFPDPREDGYDIMIQAIPSTKTHTPVIVTTENENAVHSSNYDATYGYKVYQLLKDADITDMNDPDVTGPDHETGELVTHVYLK